jgi:hypothetical protein
VTARRSWAALATLCGALALAVASAAEHPWPAPLLRPRDAGPPAAAKDAGAALAAAVRDGGHGPSALSDEDLEVVENLELLEHWKESDVLDVFLLSTDK